MKCYENKTKMVEEINSSVAHILSVDAWRYTYSGDIKKEIINYCNEFYNL